MFKSYQVAAPGAQINQLPVGNPITFRIHQMQGKASFNTLSLFYYGLLIRLSPQLDVNVTNYTKTTTYFVPGIFLSILTYTCQSRSTLNFLVSSSSFLNWDTLLPCSRSRLELLSLRCFKASTIWILRLVVARILWTFRNGRLPLSQECSSRSSNWWLSSRAVHWELDTRASAAHTAPLSSVLLAAASLSFLDRERPLSNFSHLPNGCKDQETHNYCTTS